MTKFEKEDLGAQVIRGAREYGISSVLFRHAIGERLGVNVTDMECLGVLFFKGTASPGELAMHTGLSSGATTAMLDRLQKSGLIVRQPNPNDGRGALIAVAPDAAQKVGPMFAPIRDAQNELLASYSKQELQLLIDFFGKLTAIWEAERKNLAEQD